MTKMILGATVYALALAVPAAAAPRYTPGRYSGKIAVDQASGYPGTLTFTVRHRAITRLTAHEQGMICIAPSQGGGVYDTADYTLKAPKSWKKIKIGPRGRFSFSGTLPGEAWPDVHFSGKITGHKASGKIMFGFDQSPGVTCSMSGPIHFSAKH